MAGQIKFADVIELLNHSETINIHTTPSRQSNGWELYDATFRFQIEKFPLQILYLNSRITAEEAETAARTFVPGRTHHVVYAASAKPAVSLRELFGARGAFWTLQEYLYSFISDAVVKYRQAIERERPSLYVEPPLCRALETTETSTNVGALIGVRGRVTVLLAEAGQGKTYTSKNIAQLLQKDVSFPLHVTPDQWMAMSAADLLSVSKTLVRCLEHYGSPISWVHGYEDVFLRTALQSGLAAIVFDGFDEYILRNGRALRARDVLDSLNQLAEESDSIIIITSRTSYWHNAFSDGDSEGLDVSVYRILPFTDRHAREYFGAYFYGEPLLISRAMGLFRRLAQENPEFAGRGFVLPLIGDFVAQGDADVQRPANADVAHWLFDAICEREEKKGQALGISSTQQLQALRSFACEVAGGVAPSTENFALLVYQFTELEPYALQTVMQKMEVHPLISYSSVEKLWTFKQPQIQTILIAQGLLDPAVNGIAAIGRMTLDATLREDLSSAIVGALCTKAPDQQVALAKDLLSKMYGVRGQGRPGSHSGDGPRLAGSIILTYVDRLRPGNFRTDRSEVLLALSDRGSFRGVTFSGTVARLDLKTVTFSNCTFDGVTFVKCEFGPSTVFDRCVFLGGSMPESCSAFENTQWILPREFDPPAATWLNDALAHLQGRYTEQHLERDIRCVLGRFVVGTAGLLKGAYERDMIRGSVSTSPLRDDIIDTLARYVVEITRNTTKGWYYDVRRSARDAMHFYATDNVLTGPLKAAYSDLKDKVKLS